MAQVKNKAVFETMPVPNAVLSMALPTIFGQLIVLFYNMADTFFVGRTNNPYMVAGTSLILPVFNIALAISGLAGVGGGALVSRLLGRQEPEEAHRVSNFSILLASGFALCFSLFLLLFQTPFLHFLGADSDTFLFARQYSFCVVVLGALPTVLSTTYANLFRSVGESKKASFGVTMGGLLNVALDPLFMFVLMPKGYEILGAGIATLLSNCISCLYFIFTAHSRGEGDILHPDGFGRLPCGESIRGIFSVGIPSALATFLFDVDYIVLGRLMTAYGSVQMAAVGIVLKVERLPLNVGIGICQGMTPLVAYNYASGNRSRMKQIISFSRSIGLICAIFSILVYQLLASQIMQIFISDARTVALGTDFLRIRILATPLMFMSFFTVHLFNSFGKGRYALFLGVVRWAVFNIPMLYLLNHLLGMYGIVWSQITADILTVALSLYVYLRFAKTLDKSPV